MSVLRVATINLFNHELRPSERYPLIVRGLAQARPDLVALQEVSGQHHLGPWLAQLLSAVFERDGTTYQFFEQPNLRDPSLNVGILSRLPVRRQAWVDLGGQGKVALGVTVDVDGVEIGFVSTHLFWDPDPAGEQARLYQARALLEWVAATFPSGRTVVGGDFNTTPDSLTYQLLSEHWRSAFAEVHGHEPAWTAPTLLVPNPSGWHGAIDFLFLASHGPGLSTTDAQLFLNAPAPTDITLYPSDHVGVLATLAVEAADPVGREGDQR